MLCGQFDNSRTNGGKQGIRTENKSANTPFRQRREGFVEVAWLCRVHDLKLRTKCLCSGLSVGNLS